MRLVTVVGTRPHFIKISTLSKEIRSRHAEILVHTGQHYDYDLSEGFFNQLGIPKPEYNLGIGSGPSDWQVKTMVEALINVYKTVEPQIVLVIGDTNSTLAGAIAGEDTGLPIVHVESGFRSGNIVETEENNRRKIDKITKFHCCTNNNSVNNLLLEGVPPEKSGWWENY